MNIPVATLTRECQYVWDGEYGRVRCGRLATSFSWVRAGKKVQLTFRCDAHYGKLNDTTLMTPGYKSYSKGDIETFELGYKP